MSRFEGIAEEKYCIHGPHLILYSFLFTAKKLVHVDVIIIKKRKGRSGLVKLEAKWLWENNLILSP